MAIFKGAILRCAVCSAQFKVPQSRAEKAKCCSVKCSTEYKAAKMRKRVTKVCELCGEKFETFPSQVHRRRFCSNECRERSGHYQMEKAERMKGKSNPMWKGGEVIHSDGYIYKRMQDHPFASNGYVFKHRLVMERWLLENEPKSEYLVTVNGVTCLSPDWDVHHKDCDKMNNDIANLECLTPTDHRKLHNQMRREAQEV